MNIKIKSQKEGYKTYGGLKHGKIFIQNIILKKIVIGILILQKQIHPTQLQKIKEFFQPNK
jgi:hypothetical protein